MLHNDNKLTGENVPLRHWHPAHWI